MKVSLNWLNDYVNLDGQSIDAIEHALTMVGFEVEGIEHTGLEPLAQVVVGEILSYEQHPNADRLSVCQVKVDDGEPRSIVCGAKNFKQNDRVIAALPGAVLPGGFEIKESKLRGVVSGGMLCSYKELGLGEDHSGIAILEDRPSIGTPINDVFTDSDTVFDIEITPNRPDALSHIGIARELAAWFKLKLSYPEVKANASGGAGDALVESVESETPQACPHYRGYSIRDVQVGESPEWLKKRLTAVGLRPINNVVDITNYVLHETGQPLHAFDSAKIRGNKIIVRAAREGEKLVTLDDKERKLNPTMTVIADAERALVVAGVMGSVDAEVDESTANVFLEAAWFEPTGIRKTSKSLVLSTDSSYRFERGVDPKGAEYAALRCIDMILDIAGGTVSGPVRVAGEAPLMEKEVELSPRFVRERIGFEISDDEMEAHLGALELETRPFENDAGERMLRVSIPSFRSDLYRPIDLVEEVLRMHGSDKIPEGRVRATGLLAEDNPTARFVRHATRLLAGQGFNEVMHYSLRKEADLRDWYGHIQADTLSLANPLASDASHLRPSLLPGILDCIALNQARLNHPQRLFETGRVFRENNGRVYEMVSVAFVILQEAPAGWKTREKPDFYTAAQVAIDVMETAGVKVSADRFQPVVNENPWQEGHAALFGNFKMGFELKVGLLNLAMTRDWDVNGPVYAGTLYFTPEFLQREPKRGSFKAFSSFPPATRDLALVVDAATAAGKVRGDVERIAANAAKGKFDLEAVNIFDVYVGGNLGDNQKSIALSLVFRSPERTLNDNEVNEVFNAVRDQVEKKTDYKVRS